MKNKNENDILEIISDSVWKNAPDVWDKIESGQKNRFSDIECNIPEPIKYKKTFISIRNSSIAAVFIVIIVGIYISFFYSNNSFVSSQQENKSYIISSFDTNPDPTLDDMLSYADLIIRGKVKSDGADKSKELPYAKNRLKQALTYYQVEILETLYGSEDSKTITFTQLGEADSDEVEKKVKKGDELIFILHKHPDGYNSVSLEQGLFNVFGDKKIASLSNGKNLQKYADIDTLKNNIKEKLERIKKN